MKRPVSLFLLSACAGTFIYAAFFMNFASTLSDWSGFGFTWTVQMFHNFLHGRAFQSSLFSTPATGESVGFVANPHAFIHAYVIHVNFTPYLFALVWALRQTPGFLYALIFSWNLAAGGWFAAAILRRGGREDWRDRAFLAGSVLAFGGLLSVLCQMGQMLLFAGPFMLAVYDAFLARRRGLFILWLAALTLVSEDAAMVAACYGLYFLLFEEEGRFYGVAALLVSVPYLLLLLAVVQPAARAELTLSSATTASFVARRLFSLSFRGLCANAFSMAPLAAFVPAFWLADGLFGRPARRAVLKVAGLALVPALPHWGECAIVGGGHHLLPVWSGLFLALLVWLREADRRAPARPLWIGVAAAAFFLVAGRIQAGHLPTRARVHLYRIAGKTLKSEALARSLAVDQDSNRAVISAARSVPPDRSLVYLTNNSVAGFIVSRAEVWEFPNYHDRADFVLIQKDADDANFVFDPASGANLAEILARTPAANVRGQTVSPAMVAAVRAALTRGGAYEPAVDDEHVLLLRRRERARFPDPPTTRGWGWSANLGRRAARAP